MEKFKGERRPVHVLGIAAKRFNKRIFGEQTSYLRGLIRLARKRRIKAYVFGVGDIDFDRRRVKGWVWTNQGWRRLWQPMPTVVHDRMWGLSGQRLVEFTESLQRLQVEGIPVFNPDFGDKYAVYQRLRADDRLVSHLPETSLLSVEATDELLATHRSVYIKPVRGRQGKGISRLERRRSAVLHTTRAGAKGHRRSTAVDVETAVAMSAKPSLWNEYIVQQGLDLLRVGGGTVDVRAIVQRDGKGVWHVSAVGCRIGVRGGFVSNLHAGGKAAGLPVLAPHLPRSLSLRKLRADIEGLALSTARAMNDAFSTLGEIGLDLGLDRAGHLWILEVNRQPGRALFSRARLRRSWSRSRRRVVEFAHFLSATYPTRSHGSGL